MQVEICEAPLSANTDADRLVALVFLYMFDSRTQYFSGTL